MQEVRITVILNSQGQISVEGPLNQKLLCYGLLEAGKDAVRNHKPGPQLEVVAGAAANAILGSGKPS